MKSMTGYGRGQATDNALSITVEISSVNRKQLEPAFNLPRDLAAMEPRVREMLSTQLSRGRINLLATLNHTAVENGDDLIDLVAARRAHAALKQLVERFELKPEIDLQTLLIFPGVLRTESKIPDPTAASSLLERATGIALEQMIAMRTREGRDLCADLEIRLTSIRASLQKVHRLHPPVIAKYRDAIRERVAKMGVELPLDDERLAKEVVLFADRSDISEELTRLNSHLSHFSEHLTKSEPVGRTLEFMVQEISRELNTLGAKANDAVISQIIVTCKAEMEKIREQVQNIE